MYKEKALAARKKVLSMIHRAGTSHVASNFSVIDIATVLYENLQEGDEVVWSAGWKAASIYYFLAQQGKIPMEDLEKFPQSPYFGLAEPAVNGVHVAGGSMGHGLPVAVGMALGKKRAGEAGTIYCIMSDGEMNEGTTWESAAVAAHHKLDNLVVLVDCNKWQAMGKTEDVLDINLTQAWNGFGWNVNRVDGHDDVQLGYWLLNFDELSKSPRIYLCDTIKGSGGQTACDTFEKGLLYHYKHVDEETYREATELLSKDRVQKLSQ